MPRPLEPAEEEAAALLTRTGLPRGAARCFVALLRGAPLKRADLAEIAGISAQDVSEAARALETAGLCASDALADGATGRPGKRYRLAAEARVAVGRFVAERRAALLAESHALDALAERFSA